MVFLITSKSGANISSCPCLYLRSPLLSVSLPLPCLSNSLLCQLGCLYFGQRVSYVTRGPPLSVRCPSMSTRAHVSDRGPLLPAREPPVFVRWLFYQLKNACTSQSALCQSESLLYLPVAAPRSREFPDAFDSDSERSNSTQTPTLGPTQISIA